jgi:hypothetical protein
MSPSASLHTGKHRRRALLATLVAPLVTLGIAIGPGMAHASTPALFLPAENSLGNNNCSVSGWPNGIIWCGTGVGANFPNGTQEVFGIGQDDAVWTDYGTESHPSGWKSLGGSCDPDVDYSLGLSNSGDYYLTVYCLGGNSDYWAKTRSPGVSGGWGGWHDTGVVWGYEAQLPAGILWSNGATTG